MKVDEKITQRLQAVVELGRKVLATEHESRNGGVVIDQTLAAQWVAMARNLLAGAFPTDSHSESFERYVNEGYIGPLAVKQGHGVVLGAQQDYLAGGIFNVRRLVEAEVFDDFLEQSEHLLANGYFQAAAVIAGCVLEDAMRKLCTKHGVTLPSEPKLDWMNAELAKKGVYDKLVQKRVTAESDLRNKAAHGKWDSFKREDIEAMLLWVRRFLGDH